jgi:hypothetical protein
MALKGLGAHETWLDLRGARTMTDGLYERVVQNAVRKARPNEALFKFIRASDHAPMTGELRYHGEHGVEALFALTERVFLR